MNRTARLNRFLDFRFFKNFVKVTMHSLDQLYVFRWMVGGIWIEVHGVWSEAFVFRIAADGSRYLKQTGSNGELITFHESNSAIQQIQEF